MRLQKYMAHCGAASRRKCEEFIKSGLVKVNDKIVTELGTKIDPNVDRVYLNGKRLTLENKKIYIILNKPIGVVTSASDEKDRKTVTDLVPDDYRVYPVGRLDIDTTGLVFLTNDGELANILMHPKYKIGKKYIATVEGTPNARELSILREGLDIRDLKTSPANVKILKSFKQDSIIEIEIFEGQNHQIKRMFDYIGHKVKKLKRISMGEIELLNLDVGNYRYLSEKEIKYLKGLK
ncbi:MULTISPECIES: pseudouridine synthase [Peptoniphilus]|uniref:pseudouridine synthase n=1 Tax=Peptoniphilus TaxID=162289 RepID=UPI000288361B|nr:MULTISPECIES: pseudouridine synthase [Peptoniphilus]MBS6610118.1 rRNA pseudouridine synthase [Peptoniphilus harei]MDU1043392.1 pseudouridine synthase [Peptoniphilus rhinitidis]MDU1954108.1 pseudouridine synthase [Peptoniphilus lacydonensis]MDU2115347.1 pseudouridine synthase [Peptoniphilus lacydonensis]MDU3750251.1 pseudouridine synthase [Peptoniphilus rhinitidis]